MQNPPLHCKIFLHLIPEPQEKASELLRDLIANDSSLRKAIPMGQDEEYRKKIARVLPMQYSSLTVPP
jgi:hypothetical protein